MSPVTLRDSDGVIVKKLSERKIMVIHDIPFYVSDVFISKIKIKDKYVMKDGSYIRVCNDNNIRYISNKFKISMKGLFIDTTPSKMEIGFDNDIAIIIPDVSFVAYSNDIRWLRDFKIKKIVKNDI